jgi:hypothetical protein
MLINLWKRSCYSHIGSYINRPFFCVLFKSPQAKKCSAVFTSQKFYITLPIWSFWLFHYGVQSLYSWTGGKVSPLTKIFIQRLKTSNSQISPLFKNQIKETIMTNSYVLPFMHRLDLYNFYTFQPSFGKNNNYEFGIKHKYFPKKR